MQIIKRTIGDIVKNIMNVECSNFILHKCNQYNLFNASLSMCSANILLWRRVEAIFTVSLNSNYMQ